MLPKSYLKVIAGCVIYESELSKYAKIQALRFIEYEASEMQLKAFIAEGKIRQVSEDEIFTEVAIWVPAMVIAAALAAGRVAYDQFYSKASKACKGKGLKEKQRCIRDFRLKASYAKLAALKREMGKCGQTNDAKKCRESFLKHIGKVEKQIQKDRII